MPAKKKPTLVPARLAISVGCPCGIGPEVALVAAAEAAPETRVLLVGDLGAIRAAAKVRRIAPARILRVTDPNAAFKAAPGATKEGPIFVYEPVSPLAATERASGKPGKIAGAAQLAWIDAATDLVNAGVADALVTGPVSKDAIARSGARGAKTFRGHTEHLAERLDAEEVTMAFWSEWLTVSLVTTHLPLSGVAKRITKGEVARAAYWTGRFIEELAVDVPVVDGAGPPTVAVAALNPHAGESGLLGDEEGVAIAPGIVDARSRLERSAASHVGGASTRVVLEGPVAAETAFRRAKAGQYAAVVAMYHDQATIPMKLLGFGEAVNVSLGLPIIRTSVDHGTAYDLAGLGKADARGMKEAIGLAARLVRARRPEK